MTKNHADVMRHWAHFGYGYGHEASEDMRAAAEYIEQLERQHDSEKSSRKVVWEILEEVREILKTPVMKDIRNHAREIMHKMDVVHPTQIQRWLKPDPGATIQSNEYYAAHYLVGSGLINAADEKAEDKVRSLAAELEKMYRRARFGK